jgi:hypothetical protein
MKEFEKIKSSNKPGVANEATRSGEVHNPGTEGISRRTFLGVSSTALATATLAGLTAYAQEVQDTRKAEKDISASNPGQENKALLDENPSSNTPPPTDRGDIGPVWYSFDLEQIGQNQLERETMVSPVAVWFESSLITIFL